LGRVQASLLETRLSVRAFMQEAGSAAIAAIEEHSKTTLVLAREAMDMASSHAERDKLDAMIQQLTEYSASFEKLIDIQRKLDHQEMLLKQIGPQIEKMISDDVAASAHSGDNFVAFELVNADRAMLLARIAASKFMQSHGEDFSAEVQRQKAALDSSLAA